MICEQCGTGVPAGPGFCPECGSAVKAPGPEATFKFACPHCRQRIRVPRSWGGNRGHCPACRCSLVIPAPEPELALHPAPPAACAVPLPEPALRPIPAERPIQRDVSAGENGEPEAVPQPLPPKNLSPPLPGYMRSEKTPGVSLGVLIAVIAGGAGVILVAGAFWFFLFR
ncbi:hypothetical protein [Victivallis vadensis]|uniref:Double zinc ribbon protein n=1 Tax=Victivallis vadensis TaxID=172901 RepID=A0A848AZX3_9BACT|nr:hypothetical protein [Victivallis vadensis]NMD86809.1 hypothetical protein [Victivallis vadensis]